MKGGSNFFHSTIDVAGLFQFSSRLKSPCYVLHTFDHATTLIIEQELTVMLVKAPSQKYNCLLTTCSRSFVLAI